MPEKDGRLTAEELEKGRRWLIEHDKTTHLCEYCGISRWAIGEYLGSLPLYFPVNPLRKIGAGYPVMVLVCQNCGFTKFFNAVVVGFVAPESPDKGATPNE